MRYYFAGAYQRRAELALLADELVIETVGRAEIMSRWLADPQEGLDSGFSASDLTDENAAAAWNFGARDIQDLMQSDAIVSFTGNGTRGGRHVEHGFAMAMAVVKEESGLNMRLIVIGPREHVFHCHPATEVYADFAAFLKHETSGR